MKKNLFFFLFLIPMLAPGQVTMNFGLGGIHAKTFHPVFKLSVQGEYKNFVVEAAEYPILSREVAPGNYLGFSAGYRIWKLLPTVGYLFNLRSADRKGSQMNGWKWKAGLKFLQMVNMNAGLYGEALYLDGHAGINAGIAYRF